METSRIIVPESPPTVTYYLHLTWHRREPGLHVTATRDIGDIRIGRPPSNTCIQRASTGNPQNHAACWTCISLLGSQKCIRVFLGNARSNEYNEVRIWSVTGFYIVGSTTHSSAWIEPRDTDSSRTINILSRCMKPSPISHRLSVDPSMECELCGSILDNSRNSTTTRAYGHQVQVLLELPCDLVCERTARSWITSLGPVRCRNLLSRSACENTAGADIPTWGELLGGYPGNLKRARQLPRKGEYSDESTKNRHEMTLFASCSIRSSRPSRPVNLLRSASPMFTPGRPFTLKGIGSDRLKSHRLRPCP